MIREDFVRIVLVGHIECDATPKEFGLLGAHSIGSYVSFRAIRGHSLRRIETAMQRSELSLLTALSGKQRSLIPDGQPVVLEIFVKEIACAGMHSHASQE